MAVYSPRPDKQGRVPPAPPHGTRAKGSWEKERLTDQQLLRLWLSDWPGCCPPPSPHSGHLTLHKLTNACLAFGSTADWCVTPRLLWPHCIGGAHIHTLIAHVPSHNVFSSTWQSALLSRAHPLFSDCLTYCHGDRAALRRRAPGKEGCHLVL